MSLRCRTPNIPLHTAVQSFYSGQICFLASSAIFVPVRTICLLYLVWFPNPLAPASDIKTHVSWGTRLALPNFSLRRHWGSRDKPIPGPLRFKPILQHNKRHIYIKTQNWWSIKRSLFSLDNTFQSMVATCRWLIVGYFMTAPKCLTTKNGILIWQKTGTFDVN